MTYSDLKKSIHFCQWLFILTYAFFFCFRELKLGCTEALSGKKTAQEIGVDKVDKSLVANFEILNLVPERSINNNTTGKLQINYISQSPPKRLHKPV